MFIYDRVCTFSCFLYGLPTIVSKAVLEIHLLESSASHINIFILFVRVQLLLIESVSSL